MKEKLNEPIYTLTGIVIHGRGIGKHVGVLIISNTKKKDILLFIICYRLISSALSASKYNEDFSFLRNILAGHFSEISP